VSSGWYQDSRAFFLFFSSTMNVSWITLLCAALRAAGETQPASDHQLQHDVLSPTHSGRQA